MSSARPRRPRRPLPRGSRSPLRAPPRRTGSETVATTSTSPAFSKVSTSVDELRDGEVLVQVGQGDRRSPPSPTKTVVVRRRSRSPRRRRHRRATEACRLVTSAVGAGDLGGGEALALDGDQGVGLLAGVDDGHGELGVVAGVVAPAARVGSSSTWRRVMSPTSAMAPTLSRSCVAVCVTWPALHADRATGENRATPTRRRAARGSRPSTSTQVRVAATGAGGPSRAQTIGHPTMFAGR